ncbi:MAG: CAP domain-containing protein [Sandaracinaceae bacterium]
MSRLAAALIASLALVPALASAQAIDPAAETAMLAEINALRAENNLGALTRDAGLDAAARVHAAEMASQGQLSHVSPTTGTPEDRARATGMDTGAVLENVAVHSNAAFASRALFASPPHRGNMLNAAVNTIGIGVVSNEGQVYVAQLFVERRAPAPVAAAPAPAAPAPAAAPVEIPAFGLIPPFAEQALGQAAGTVAEVGNASVGALGDAADQAGATAEPALEMVAPPLAPSDEDADADAAMAAPADATVTAPAAAPNPLTQLVDIGQALLRAVTAPRPAPQQ